MEIIDGYNSGGDGRKTVTTAGTAVALSDTSVPCRRITVQAERDNTGFIAVGFSSSVNATAGSERGAILGAGEAVDVYTSNLDKVQINSTVNGDGVTFVYYSG